jgi:hypothetical protein
MEQNRISSLIKKLPYPRHRFLRNIGLSPNGNDEKLIVHVEMLWMAMHQKT